MSRENHNDHLHVALTAKRFSYLPSFSSSLLHHKQELTALISSRPRSSSPHIQAIYFFMSSMSFIFLEFQRQLNDFAYNSAERVQLDCIQCCLPISNHYYLDNCHPRIELSERLERKTFIHVAQHVRIFDIPHHQIFLSVIS